MRAIYNGAQTEPVPRRGIRYFVIGSTMILTGIAAALAGYLQAPEMESAPVVTAGGEVISQPWCIAVDGKQAAVVASREDAEQAIERVIDAYQPKQDEVLDVQVQEKIEIRPMKLKHGDQKPLIQTADEADHTLEHGTNGDGRLTVCVTAQETKEEPIAFREEYKADADLFAGETKMEQEGRAGIKEVTRQIVRENGEIIEEEVLEETVAKEPQNAVVLTGTKPRGSYGGGEISVADQGVSYDETAIYDKLQMPVGEICVSSEFGPRWGRMHQGIDLALPQGSEICAANSGTVYFSGNGGGYGNLVKVDHGNGMQTYYAHCSKLLVSEGQQVAAGECIALAGSTGNSTGPHLHFQVIINGSCVDPRDFLDL